MRCEDFEENVVCFLKQCALAAGNRMECLQKITFSRFNDGVSEKIYEIAPERCILGDMFELEFIPLPMVIFDVHRLPESEYTPEEILEEYQRDIRKMVFNKMVGHLAMKCLNLQVSFAALTIMWDWLSNFLENQFPNLKEIFE